MKQKKLFYILIIFIGFSFLFFGCPTAGNPEVDYPLWTGLTGVKNAASLTGYTKGYAITVDSNRNSYVTGTTDGDLDDQSKIGGLDGFVIKYNSAGDKLWTRIIGAVGTNTACTGIATDLIGNTFIVGGAYGNLNGQTKTGAMDLFVIKYNSEGVLQWTHLLGVSGNLTQGNGVAVDSSGDCYVTGITRGSLDGETFNGTQDAFIVKYNSLGSRQWTKLTGNPSGKSTTGVAIAVDSNKNSYITGFTNGDLDGETFTGISDAFVSKYNSSGIKQWTKFLGTSAFSNETYSRGIAVDSSGNSFITGYTGTGNLNGEIRIGTIDAFLMKFDTNGTKKWTKLIGSSLKETIAYSIVVDSVGNNLITGTTTGSIDEQPITGIRDIFVSKYNSTGIKQWTKLLGSNSYESFGQGISVDHRGKCYVTGYVYSDLDDQTKTGLVDVFVSTRINK